MLKGRVVGYKAPRRVPSYLPALSLYRVLVNYYLIRLLLYVVKYASLEYRASRYEPLIVAGYVYWLYVPTVLLYEPLDRHHVLVYVRGLPEVHPVVILNVAPAPYLKERYLYYVVSAPLLHGKVYVIDEAYGYLLCVVLNLVLLSAY